jgi:ubiquinone/menaquinone biosynthesis C-methylase UbiE
LNSFDKAKIRFHFPDDPTWLAGHTSPPKNFKPLFSVSYADKSIAHVHFERDNSIISIALNIFESCVPDDFLGPAILKNLKIECDQTVSSLTEQLEMCLVSDDFLKFEGSLKEFGFSKSTPKNVYSARHSTGDAYKLGAMKRQFMALTQGSPKVGRGYTIDISGEGAETLSALASEYNEIAWGLTNWARHDELANDEASVVKAHAHGDHAIEVGAGSGRMTPFLAAAVTKLVATDYASEVIAKLNEVTNNLKNASAVLDDITQSQFPTDSFDLAMFWENGLGSLLSLSRRKLALSEMVRILKPGGKLILGMRRLEQSPIDHLMIATQNRHIMGIYHTFSPEEIRECIPKNAIESTLIEGDSRPAGGRQFFMIFNKESR